VIFKHHDNGAAGITAAAVSHIILFLIPSSRKAEVCFHRCFTVTALFALAVFVATSAGCVGSMKNYGYYAPDTEVTKMFAACDQSPHYQYYYCGPKSGPTAILGIEKGYVLEGNLWQPIPDDREIFTNLLDDMNSAVFRIGQTLRGYKLYSSEGIFLGVWYAIFSATPVIHMQGENRIAVYGPPADLYRRDERNLFLSPR